MKKLFVILIPLILLLPMSAGAVIFTFENHSNQTAYYWAWWVDHPHKEILGPMNICGGEVQKGDSHQVSYQYPAGIYGFRITIGESEFEDLYKISADMNVVISIGEDGVELLGTALDRI